MDQKMVGKTGIPISAIGLGSSPFGREIDEDASLRVLDYAFEQGFTFFDTAETPTRVGGEWLLGRWMCSRGIRDQCKISTKVSQGGARAENIARAIVGSLERLQSDQVEFYKIHNPDTTVPAAETVEAMSALVDAGQVKVVGCSNYSPTQLQEALAAADSGGLARFEIVQPPYSLALPEGQEGLFPLCVTEGVSITPHSPLGSGFLAGKYVPDRTKIPRGTRFDVAPGHIDVYFSDRNFRVAERLRQKSAELGLPMVRLAMAWAMTNPHVTAVIIGARTPEQVDNALEAYEMGLDPELRTEMSAWN